MLYICVYTVSHMALEIQVNHRRQETTENWKMRNVSSICVSIKKYAILCAKINLRCNHLNFSSLTNVKLNCHTSLPTVHVSLAPIFPSANNSTGILTACKYSDWFHCYFKVLIDNIFNILIFFMFSYTVKHAILT